MMAGSEELCLVFSLICLTIGGAFSTNCNRTIDIRETIVSPDFEEGEVSVPFTCWFKYKPFPTANPIVKITFERFKIGKLQMELVLGPHAG